MIEENKQDYGLMYHEVLISNEFGTLVLYAKDAESLNKIKIYAGKLMVAIGVQNENG